MLAIRRTHLRWGTAGVPGWTCTQSSPPSRLPAPSTGWGARPASTHGTFGRAFGHICCPCSPGTEQKGYRVGLCPVLVSKLLPGTSGPALHTPAGWCRGQSSPPGGRGAAWGGHQSPRHQTAQTARKQPGGGRVGRKMVRDNTGGQKHTREDGNSVVRLARQLRQQRRRRSGVRVGDDPPPPTSSMRAPAVVPLPEAWRPSSMCPVMGSRRKMRVSPEAMPCASHSSAKAPCRWGGEVGSGGGELRRCCARWVGRMLPREQRGKLLGIEASPRSTAPPRRPTPPTAPTRSVYCGRLSLRASVCTRHSHCPPWGSTSTAEPALRKSSLYTLAAGGGSGGRMQDVGGGTRAGVGGTRPQSSGQPGGGQRSAAARCSNLACNPGGRPAHALALSPQTPYPKCTHSQSARCAAHTTRAAPP